MLRTYPIVPKPDIFGLHENADITCDQNETYDLFATVLSLQPRVATGAGASREDAITTQCDSIAARLPAAFDLDAVAAAYPTMYEESMNTVLVQECIRFAPAACFASARTRFPGCAGPCCGVGPSVCCAHLSSFVNVCKLHRFFYAPLLPERFRRRLRE